MDNNRYESVDPEVISQKYMTENVSPKGGSEYVKYMLSTSKNFQASQMPMKNKITTFESNVKELRQEINENKKQVQMLKSDCLSLEHKNKEICNDLLAIMMEEIYGLDKEFKKLSQADAGEVNFIKKQTSDLHNEKIMLEQKTLLLGDKIATLEEEIGYECASSAYTNN